MTIFVSMHLVLEIVVVVVITAVPGGGDSDAGGGKLVCTCV